MGSQRTALRLDAPLKRQLNDRRRIQFARRKRALDAPHQGTHASRVTHRTSSLRNQPERQRQPQTQPQPEQPPPMTRGREMGLGADGSSK